MADDDDLRAKRTMHVLLPLSATDEEVDRFEDAVVDAAYGFQLASGDGAWVHSHAGDCADDPHCGGANPWRERALAAEAKLRALHG